MEIPTQDLPSKTDCSHTTTQSSPTDIHSDIHNESGPHAGKHPFRALRLFIRRYYKAYLAALSVISLLVVGAAGSSYAARTHHVMVNVDGVVRPARGWITTVNDALRVSHISLGTHDSVVPTPDTPLSDNQTITVERGHQVWIEKKGKISQTWLTGRSLLEQTQGLRLMDPQATLVVSRSGVTELPLSDNRIKVTIDGKTGELPGGSSLEMLVKKMSLTLGALDELRAHYIEPAHIAFDIESTKRSVVVEEKAIDFNVEQEKTDSLYEGTQQVVTPGQKGIDSYTYAVITTKSGQERRLISRVRVSDPVTEVVKVGTKKKAPSGDTSSTTSYDNSPVANPSDLQSYAFSNFSAYGFPTTNDQKNCLVNLWNRESGWNPKAHNPSGAHGIPQALPGSKMASAGSDWQTNGQTQIRWGLGYIKSRYGTPCGAWSYWQKSKAY